ncbi:flavin reductase family protein [Nocardioides ginsengisoli]|jgi:flavin reductase (DIM6/NTAB) family NADH-FMN oxidoreductase RutF|uniref:Flavin reductase family protein n=1 Tax=Nocardioides ginsengisoli TaxID=363868 RepID=A0ABW3W5H1_9ACTN
MDPHTLRSTFGRFATGVTVITCRTPDGAHHGATVTAFTPISLDPPLVQVALTRTSKAAGLLDGAAFAVNVLAADQVDVAMHFAGRPSPDRIPWSDGTTAPALAGTAATITCRPWRTDDGGDHLLFLGEVVDVRTTGRRPLLFHDSAFHQIGSRSSDAVWLGCQDDPHTSWFGALVPADTHY